METSRRRSHGEIRAGAEKQKIRPKRRACAQKLLSQKAPENEIMQDTRGEALAGEALGKKEVFRRTAFTTRRRSNGAIQAENEKQKSEWKQCASAYIVRSSRKAKSQKYVQSDMPAHRIPESKRHPKSK